MTAKTCADPEFAPLDARAVASKRFGVRVLPHAINAVADDWSANSMPTIQRSVFFPSILYKTPSLHTLCVSMSPVKLKPRQILVTRGFLTRLERQAATSLPSASTETSQFRAWGDPYERSAQTGKHPRVFDPNMSLIHLV